MSTIYLVNITECRIRVLDTRYWHLLENVLSTAQVPLKTWLPPILNRIPISTPVISFLSTVKDVPPEESIALSKEVYNCLAIIWPLSVRKVNTETLLECLGALFVAVNSEPFDTNICHIGTWICKSFNISLSNSSNKKKVR